MPESFRTARGLQDVRMTVPPFTNLSMALKCVFLEQVRVSLEAALPMAARAKCSAGCMPLGTVR